MVNQAKSMFDKIWARHIVSPETADTPAVLYIDLHLTHEVTTPQAFALLRERGLAVAIDAEHEPEVACASGLDAGDGVLDHDGLAARGQERCHLLLHLGLARFHLLLNF